MSHWSLSVLKSQYPVMVQTLIIYTHEYLLLILPWDMLSFRLHVIITGLCLELFSRAGDQWVTQSMLKYNPYFKYFMSVIIILVVLPIPTLNLGFVIEFQLDRGEYILEFGTLILMRSVIPLSPHSLVEVLRCLFTSSQKIAIIWKFLMKRAMLSLKEKFSLWRVTLTLWCMVFSLPWLTMCPVSFGYVWSAPMTI